MDSATTIYDNIVTTKNGRKRRVYGIDFPEDKKPYEIELHCCFRDEIRKTEQILEKKEHFWNFVELMFPDFCQRDNYFMDIFFENALSNKHKFYFVLGPGGFGKTTCSALLALGLWLDNPKENAVITCTTTLESSETRIWGKVKYFYSRHTEEFSKFSKMIKDKIYYYKRDGQTIEKDTFHCMRVSPLPQGSGGADSVLRGMHPDKKLLLILDELDQSASVDEVVENLQRGDVDFTLIGMGNPQSRWSALGLCAQPWGGWESIDPMGFTDTRAAQWDSVIEDGRVLFFPGYLSPRIYYTKKYPEKADYYSKRFAFFSSEEEIEYKRKTLSHAKFMEQIIGFFAENPTDATQYVLDTNDITIHDAHRAATFSGYSNPITFCGVDPAFTHGGDQTIVRFAKLAPLTNGKLGLCYLGKDAVHKVVLPKNLNTDKYAWLADRIIELAKKFNVEPQHFSMDCNTAADALVEQIKHKWSHEIYAVSSRGKASDRPLYFGQSLTARDECTNRVTEYWFAMRKFILSDQIRGLDKVTIDQLCSRCFLSKPSTNKVTLEPKGDYRKRMTSIGVVGNSPDEADAAVYILENARNFDLIVDYQGDVERNSRVWRNQTNQAIDDFYSGKREDRISSIISKAGDYHESVESDDFTILDFGGDDDLY